MSDNDPLCFFCGMEHRRYRPLLLVDCLATCRAKMDDAEKDAKHQSDMRKIAEGQLATARAEVVELKDGIKRAGRIGTAMAVGFDDVEGRNQAYIRCADYAAMRAYNLRSEAGAQSEETRKGAAKRAELMASALALEDVAVEFRKGLCDVLHEKPEEVAALKAEVRRLMEEAHPLGECRVQWTPKDQAEVDDLIENAVKDERKRCLAILERRVKASLDALGRSPEMSPMKAGFKHEISALDRAAIEIKAGNPA